MITATIADLLAGELDYSAAHRLYLVRDGETIFYVGQSKDPETRLKQHLGLVPGWAGKSQLGEFILVNLPQSGQWVIELYTYQDGELYAKKYFSAYTFYDIDDCEQALILEHRPCLNIMHNLNRTPLPGCYKSPWARIANEGVMIKEDEV